MSGSSRAISSPSWQTRSPALRFTRRRLMTQAKGWPCVSRASSVSSARTNRPKTPRPSKRYRRCSPCRSARSVDSLNESLFVNNGSYMLAVERGGNLLRFVAVDQLQGAQQPGVVEKIKQNAVEGERLKA